MKPLKSSWFMATVIYFFLSYHLCHCFFSWRYLTHIVCNWLYNFIQFTCERLQAPLDAFRYICKFKSITKNLCYECLSRVNLLRINLTRIVVMKLSIIFDRYDWKGRQIFINVKWYFRYSVPLKLYWLDYDFSKLNSNVLQKQTIFCSLWWSSIFLCRLIIFEIDLNSLIEYLFKKRISDHVLVIGLIIFFRWRKPKKLRGVIFLTLLQLVHFNINEV